MSCTSYARHHCFKLGTFTAARLLTNNVSAVTFSSSIIKPAPNDSLSLINRHMYRQIESKARDKKDIATKAYNHQKPASTSSRPVIGKPLPIDSALAPSLRTLSITAQTSAKKTPQATKDSIPTTFATKNRANNKKNNVIDWQKLSGFSSIMNNIHTLTTQVSVSSNVHIVTKSQVNTDSQLGTQHADSLLSSNATAVDTSHKTQDIHTATKTDSKIARDIQTGSRKIEPNITNIQVANKPIVTNSTPAIAVSTKTYTVKENDNLWTIASQISKKNHLKIQTVIQQIKTINPDAFIDGNINKLKPNSKLRLPAYEKTPSSLGINASMADHKSQQNKPFGVTNQAKATNNKPSTQSTIDAKIGNNRDNRLHSTHHLAASNKHHVKIADNQVRESSNRMSIQNQRLAELERRLQALRNK